MNIGLAVDGMAVGSFAMPAFAVGSPALESATSGRGWAAPGPGSAFSIVGSLRTHTPDPSGPAETSGRAVSALVFSHSLLGCYFLLCWYHSVSLNCLGTWSFKASA